MQKVCCWRKGVLKRAGEKRGDAEIPKFGAQRCLAFISYFTKIELFQAISSVK